jgi:hypothetical protein
MKRMQKFLLTDEVMVKCIKYEEGGNNAVSMQDGDFYWSHKGVKALPPDDPEKPVKTSKVEPSPTPTVLVDEEDAYMPIIRGINF